MIENSKKVLLFQTFLQAGEPTAASTHFREEPGNIKGLKM